MNHYSANTHALNYIDKTATLGDNVKVWHYSVVLADVVIGDNVSVGSHSEIGRGTTIGKDSRISAHVFLPPHTTIGERVFIAPGVVMCDDKQPRAGNSEYKAEPPTILNGASVGAGSVILPGVTIGRGAMIGAGSVITRDVPDGAVVRGEPARLRYSTNFDIYAEKLGEHGQVSRVELMEASLR